MATGRPCSIGYLVECSPRTKRAGIMRSSVNPATSGANPRSRTQDEQAYAGPAIARRPRAGTRAGLGVPRARAGPGRRRRARAAHRAGSVRASPTEASALQLVTVGAHYDVVELLRPGWPLHRELDQLAARAPGDAERPRHRLRRARGQTSRRAHAAGRVRGRAVAARALRAGRRCGHRHARRRSVRTRPDGTRHGGRGDGACSRRTPSA